MISTLPARFAYSDWIFPVKATGEGRSKYATDAFFVDLGARVTSSVGSTRGLWLLRRRGRRGVAAQVDAEAHAGGEIEKHWDVLAHPRVASAHRVARIEAVHECPLGVVDPLIDVADHVVNAVVAPGAAASRGSSGGLEERCAVDGKLVQTRIPMTERGISVEDGGRMLRLVDIADALLVLLAVREAGVLFAAASGLPFFQLAQPFSRCFARGFGGRFA